VSEIDGYDFDKMRMSELIDFDRPSDETVYPRRTRPRPASADQDPNSRHSVPPIRIKGWTHLELDGQPVRVRGKTLGGAASMMLVGEPLGQCSARGGCVQAARAGTLCRHLAALVLAEHGLRYEGSAP
jgi:hypothetical protein